MQCLKCGQPVADGVMFCAACATEMDKSPVKPGTPVTIPVRPKRIVRAVTQEKPEEQIERLRHKLRRARLCAGAFLMAAILCAGALAYFWFNHEHGFSIGQNYQTVTGPASQGGR